MPNDIDSYLSSLGITGTAPEVVSAAQPSAQAPGLDVNSLADAVAARLSQGQRHPDPATNQGGYQASAAGMSDPSDVTKWSSEDYERQFQLRAPIPHNRHDIRNREFFREIRRNAEKHMANTRISLGGRK